MKSLSVLGALLLILPGCEEGSNLSDLPYVERMVINGIVEAGQNEIEVVFTRTLRQDETYSPEKAALDDVDARILFRGEAFPLVHDSAGIYRTQVFLIEAGDLVELEAQWGNRLARATTVVPPPAEVVASAYSTDTTGGSQVELVTRVKISVGVAYGQTWERRSPGQIFSGGTFSEVVQEEDSRSDGTASIIERYSLIVGVSDTLYSIVHSYDRAFYDYFRTRGSNQPGYDDLLFRQTGGPISWNVTGDGIGMFVGHTTNTVRAIPR